jgi:hypothetical protein
MCHGRVIPLLAAHDEGARSIGAQGCHAAFRFAKLVTRKKESATTWNAGVAISLGYTPTTSF